MWKDSVKQFNARTLYVINNIFEQKQAYTNT